MLTSWLWPVGCAALAALSAPWWGGGLAVPWAHRLSVAGSIVALNMGGLFFDKHWDPNFAVFVSLWTVMAYVDWRERIIPNRLILLTVGWGVIATPWSGRLLLVNVATGAGLLIFFFLINLVTRGGVGMGDVKFSGAEGFALGWPQGLLALAMGIWAAGIYALALVLFFRRTRQQAIALGPFLALGGFLGLLGVIH